MSKKITDINSNNSTQNKEIEQSWIAEGKRRIDSCRKGKTGTVTEEEVFSHLY